MGRFTVHSPSSQDPEDSSCSRDTQPHLDHTKCLLHLKLDSEPSVHSQIIFLILLLLPVKFLFFITLVFEGFHDFLVQPVATKTWLSGYVYVWRLVLHHSLLCRPKFLNFLTIFPYSHPLLSGLDSMTFTVVKYLTFRVTCIFTNFLITTTTITIDGDSFTKINY